jgi:hypothetical protein
MRLFLPSAFFFLLAAAYNNAAWAYNQRLGRLWDAMDVGLHYHTPPFTLFLGSFADGGQFVGSVVRCVRVGFSSFLPYSVFTTPYAGTLHLPVSVTVSSKLA